MFQGGHITPREDPSVPLEDFQGVRTLIKVLGPIHQTPPPRGTLIPDSMSKSGLFWSLHVTLYAPFADVVSDRTRTQRGPRKSLKTVPPLREALPSQSM